MKSAKFVLVYTLEFRFAYCTLTDHVLYTLAASILRVIVCQHVLGNFKPLAESSLGSLLPKHTGFNLPETEQIWPRTGEGVTDWYEALPESKTRKNLSALFSNNSKIPCVSLLNSSELAS
jgi:hypothetical protein